MIRIQNQQMLEFVDTTWFSSGGVGWTLSLYSIASCIYILNLVLYCMYLLTLPARSDRRLRRIYLAQGAAMAIRDAAAGSLPG